MNMRRDEAQPVKRLLKRLEVETLNLVRVLQKFLKGKQEKIRLLDFRDSFDQADRVETWTIHVGHRAH